MRTRDALRALGGALAAAAMLAGAATAETVLIRGARIFDGTSSELTEGRDVLVEGGMIARVAAGIDAPEGARVIEAEGRTLMPGLTDAHVHLMLSDVPAHVAMTADLGYLSHAAAGAAEATLMRGFTTVRDMGGPALGLRRAIDEGLIPGPRIYPSGPTISQTSGHGDFRAPQATPAAAGEPLDYMQRNGYTLIADGVPEVLKRVRETLRMGATQIKVMAGGGVASDFDPLDVSAYTAAELRAAVEAAETWNTYVAVHAYTPTAVRRAVEAGVRVIEHGQMIDEATAALMAERGTWLSLQPFLDDEDAIPFPEGSPNRVKQMLMVAGTDRAYALAKRHGLRTAFGTDTLFSAALGRRQGAQLAKLARWYEPWEVLRMATSGNHALFKLAGPRDPWPEANGVVAEGAYADLILVEGNPLEDLSLIAVPETAFVMIMKDGVIWKDALE